MGGAYQTATCRLPDASIQPTAAGSAVVSSPRSSEMAKETGGAAAYDDELQQQTTHCEFHRGSACTPSTPPWAVIARSCSGHGTWHRLQVKRLFYLIPPPSSCNPQPRLLAHVALSGRAVISS